MAYGAYAIQCPIKAGRFNLHLYVGHTNVFIMKIIQKTFNSIFIINKYIIFLCMAYACREMSQKHPLDSQGYKQILLPYFFLWHMFFTRIKYSSI